jgi:hypothetical protein
VGVAVRSPGLLQSLVVACNCTCRCCSCLRLACVHRRLHSCAQCWGFRPMQQGGVPNSLGVGGHMHRCCGGFASWWCAGVILALRACARHCGLSPHGVGCQQGIGRAPWCQRWVAAQLLWWRHCVTAARCGHLGAARICAALGLSSLCRLLMGRCHWHPLFAGGGGAPLLQRYVVTVACSRCLGTACLYTAPRPLSLCKVLVAVGCLQRPWYTGGADTPLHLCSLMACMHQVCIKRSCTTLGRFVPEW